MPRAHLSSRPASQAALLLLALSVPVQSFFFSTGRAKSQAPQWFGIRDYGVPAQAAYSYDSTGGVTVAVPVAIPIPHQQVSPPYPGLAPVQLVPCLCPISKDPEAVKPVPTSSSGAQPAQPAQQALQAQHAQQALQAQHAQQALQAQHAQQALQAQQAHTAMQMQMQPLPAPPSQQ